MNAVNTTILDLDSLLDTSMDAVENVPDFVTPPPGNYALKVSKCELEKYKSKADPKTEKNRIRLSYLIVATIQVADGCLPVADGSLFSETFMATEEGLKYFKKAAATVMNTTDFGGASLRDVMTALVGEEFNARITVKKSKDDSGAEFENVNVRALPPAA